MRGAVGERKDWHGGGASGGGGGGGECDVRDRDGGPGARVPVPLKHVNRVLWIRITLMRTGSGSSFSFYCGSRSCSASK
jgi:hypothetical protein